MRLRLLVPAVLVLVGTLGSTAGCTSDDSGGRAGRERGDRTVRTVAEPTDGAPQPWRSGAGRPARPNIVLITTDDQTMAELRWMPRTRRLIGGAGVRFTDFLSNHPNCCPARAEILTGQYAQNNQVLTNGPRWGGYDRFRPETAMPVWLQRAGYTTGLVGKYLNLYDETDGPEPGWSRWSATVDGLYEYVGFTQYDGDALSTPAGHHTAFVRDWSVDFIREQARADEPFFLWSSYVAPHSICGPSDPEGEWCSTPPLPEARDRSLFRHVRPPFLDDPAFGRKIQHNVRPRLLYRDPQPDPVEKTRLFRERLRSLAGVDRAVARTIATLRAADALDDTVVVFTSDNGFLFGEHQLKSKDVPSEQAVHVPLLARGPGIRPGTVRRPGAMIDLAPTFAELAGAEPLVAVDGRSLVGAFGGPDRSGDRTVLVQGGVTGADPDDRMWAYRGVRTLRYTYVRWTKNGGVELFDRERDPHELRNVARDPRYHAIRRELRRRAELLGACAGPACRTTFGLLPEPGGR